MTIDIPRAPGRHRRLVEKRGPLWAAGLAIAAVAALIAGIAPQTMAQADANEVGLWGNVVPASPSNNNGARTELGVVFRSSVAGSVTGLEFYKASRNTGIHIGSLWTGSGTRLAKAQFTSETGSGWQRVTFAKPISVKAGVDYVASYHTDAGNYSADLNYFARPRVVSPLTATEGVYAYGRNTFPTSTWEDGNYYVDVVFKAANASAPSTSAPAPSTSAPAPSTSAPAPSTSAPAPSTSAPAPSTSAPAPSTSAPAPSTSAPAPSTSAPAPPQSGWPNASNTGVPAGTALTPMSGTLTVSTPGTVVDAKDINGCIVIKASNVTVKRTRVSGSGCVNSHQIDTGDGQYTGILLEDVEVDGKNTSAYGAGIGNTGFTCRRCNIHNVGQGVHLDSNGGVEYSFIHDLYGQGDPATSGSHNEPIFAGGGSNLVIRGNELRANWAAGSNGGGMSAALALYGWLAQQNNVLVDQNRFSSVEGYCTYGGATHTYTNPTNVRFTNNRFVRSSRGTCGDYGPVTAYKSGSGNVWTGNVWDDTGATINAG